MPRPHTLSSCDPAALLLRFSELHAPGFPKYTCVPASRQCISAPVAAAAARTVPPLLQMRLERRAGEARPPLLCRPPPN